MSFLREELKILTPPAPPINFDDYDNMLMRVENCQSQVDNLKRKELHGVVPSELAVDIQSEEGVPNPYTGMTEAEQLAALRQFVNPELFDEFGLPILPPVKTDSKLALFRLGSTRPGSTEDAEEMQWRLDDLRRSTSAQAETLPATFTVGTPSAQTYTPLQRSIVSRHTMKRFRGTMREWCNQKKWIQHKRLRSTPGTFLYVTCQFHDDNCTFVMKIQQADQHFHDEFELLRNFGGHTRRLPVLFDAWYCGGLGYLILGSRVRQ